LLILRAGSRARPAPARKRHARRARAAPGRARADHARIVHVRADHAQGLKRRCVENGGKHIDKFTDAQPTVPMQPASINMIRRAERNGLLARGAALSQMCPGPEPSCRNVDRNPFRPSSLTD